MKILRTILSALVGVPIALLYGWLVRLTFTSGKTTVDLSPLTCGFLFVVPLAMGALTVWLAPKELRGSYPYAIFMPWISVFIAAAGSIAMYLEAVICVLMALPLFMFFSSAGGVMVYWIHKAKNKPSQNALLGLILLAPYLVTPFEMKIPAPDSYRYVENQIIIHAPASKVWEQIISIPRIAAEEQGFSIFHLFGVPKLLEAPLSYDGIGGTREITFENGLSFIETVTSWDEFNRVSFSISTDPKSTAPAPFNMVGKKYFGVTEMNWWIEELDNDTVILYLRSQHRLSTHLNSYAGIWTDFMMSNLQSYVLRMIKARAEGSSP
jgi:hypothetical protein